MLRNAFGNRPGAIPFGLAIWSAPSACTFTDRSDGRNGCADGQDRGFVRESGCERHRNSDERGQRPGTKRHDGDGWLL